jgi:signal transduction histidine kinase/CheY-like chemotaxis protein
MFEKIVTEFIVGTVTALFAGMFSFFFLDLSFEQSLALTLVLMLFLPFPMILYKRYQLKNKVVPSSREDNEAYLLLESKLKVMTQKAEQLEKENKGTEMFLASMSHEIRTPLNGIIGLTELLEGTSLDEEQQEFVSMIRESSDNLRVIVNDILDVSKINAGKMELEHISFDLFAKLEAAAGMFVPKMDEKGIVLNLFTDPKIPQQVIGDPTRLTQVITNLVSNAVKFTKPGGKIDVFAEYVREDNTHVTFKLLVSDSGIGLTQEQQARIFDAYSQAEASTTRKAGGTGLGLTISSKIVKSMGSTLRVKSKEGEGATFYFTLTLPKDRNESQTLKQYDGIRMGMLCTPKNPHSQWKRILAQYVKAYGAEYKNMRMEDLSGTGLPDVLLVEQHSVSQEELAQLKSLPCKKVLLAFSSQHTALAKAREIFDEVVYVPIGFEKVGTLLQLKEEHSSKPEVSTVQEEEKRTFENLHVLVAEDNPINQKLIKIVLENFGLQVTLADNGIEAFEKRKEGAFDMIFMDIQMPEMGGVEATHEILKYEEEQHLPHIPIIALTANALSGDREKYMAEGMDDYATKPLEVDAIERLISKYCSV